MIAHGSLSGDGEREFEDRLAVRALSRSLCPGSAPIHDGSRDDARRSHSELTTSAGERHVVAAGHVGEGIKDPDPPGVGVVHQDVALVEALQTGGGFRLL